MKTLIFRFAILGTLVGTIFSLNASADYESLVKERESRAAAESEARSLERSNRRSAFELNALNKFAAKHGGYRQEPRSKSHVIAFNCWESALEFSTNDNNDCVVNTCFDMDLSGPPTHVRYPESFFTLNCINSVTLKDSHQIIKYWGK